MHEKQIEIGYLLDFYGDLLTERKRSVLDMYYNEDMSLSEISADLGITRQGVLDTIKKAGNELLFFEEKLGAARKFRLISEKVAEAQRLLKEKRGDEELSLLKIIFFLNQIQILILINIKPMLIT